MMWITVSIALFIVYSAELPVYDHIGIKGIQDGGYEPDLLLPDTSDTQALLGPMIHTGVNIMSDPTII